MTGPAFRDDLAVRLQAALAEVAATIIAHAPGARFHFEFPASRLYAFVGLLIFTHEDDPTTEEAVLSVQLSELPTTTWTIDIVGRDSVLLAELTNLSPDSALRMAAEPAAAADTVTTFLRENAGLIAREIDGQ